MEEKVQDGQRICSLCYLFTKYVLSLTLVLSFQPSTRHLSSLPFNKSTITEGFTIYNTVDHLNNEDFPI